MLNGNGTIQSQTIVVGVCSQCLGFQMFYLGGLCRVALFILHVALIDNNLKIYNSVSLSVKIIKVCEWRRKHVARVQEKEKHLYQNVFHLVMDWHRKKQQHRACTYLFRQMCRGHLCDRNTTPLPTLNSNVFNRKIAENQVTKSKIVCLKRISGKCVTIKKNFLFSSISRMSSN